MTLFLLSQVPCLFFVFRTILTIQCSNSFGEAFSCYLWDLKQKNSAMPVLLSQNGLPQTLSVYATFHQSRYFNFQSKHDFALLCKDCYLDFVWFGGQFTQELGQLLLKQCGTPALSVQVCLYLVSYQCCIDLALTTAPSTTFQQGQLPLGSTFDWCCFINKSCGLVHSHIWDS